MAKRKISMCPMLLAVIVVLAWMPTLAGAKTRYLKNNIHYQERADLGGKTVCRASYANYVDPGQGHKVLPVNTTVEIKLTRGWRGRQLTITKLADGTLIHLEYNECNMKIPMKDYIGIISSSKKVSLKGLSKLDRKGIRNGKAYKGMSKKGVRMALGYPAKHRTPSLEDNSWTYWKDRYRTTVITFNSKGKVSAIR
jgi:hypothetical protein